MGEFTRLTNHCTVTISTCPLVQQTNAQTGWRNTVQMIHHPFFSFLLYVFILSHFLFKCCRVSDYDKLW